MSRDLLIDVRTPAEYATGHLTSDLSPTLNIPYQDISTLVDVYATTHNITVDKNDRITLYCRSGRRSDIACRELKQLGYANVRDIGGLEEARRVLDWEVVERQLGG
ncbi:PspE Rhodanese-related sulfurtransferase [Pyrenophora tritici-repentis]|nr:PspE Rhodanese-related sulfurtransferase [Pyrenophora tritici-repentis]